MGGTESLSIVVTPSLFNLLRSCESGSGSLFCCLGTASEEEFPVCCCGSIDRVGVAGLRAPSSCVRFVLSTDMAEELLGEKYSSRTAAVFLSDC
jgi:hypothetical protein